MQNYYIRKRDILAVILVILTTLFISEKQYRPLDKTIATASVDGSMHYSAATNFADEMKALAKINNTTGYNFKTMQTGAYINTGIFMNIVRSVIPSWEDYVTFKVFETAVTALVILSFYMLISEKLKDRKSYIIGMVFVVLYSYAYPYTSLLHGFSYLSVCLIFATALFYMAKEY